MNKFQRYEIVLAKNGFVEGYEPTHQDLRKTKIVYRWALKHGYSYNDLMKAIKKERAQQC